MFMALSRRAVVCLQFVIEYFRSYSLTIYVCLQRIPVHCSVPGNERAYVLAKLGATGNQPLNIVTHQEKATAIKTLTKPKSSKDDYRFLKRWEQVTIFRLRTGHNRFNAHMCPKLKLSTPHVRLWPEAGDSRVHHAALPLAGANEEDCVTNVDFSSD